MDRYEVCNAHHRPKLIGYASTRQAAKRLVMKHRTASTYVREIASGAIIMFVQELSAPHLRQIAVPEN